MYQKHIIIFNEICCKLSLSCKYIILNNFLIFKLLSRMYLQKLIYPIEINYPIAANHLGRLYAYPRLTLSLPHLLLLEYIKFLTYY